MIHYNALVTGGAGFIGSQLVKKLMSIFRHIYIIDNLSTGQKNAIPLSPKITFFQETITDPKLLNEVMPKISHVFHLACSNMQQSVMDMDTDFNTNLYGCYLLLKKAHQYGIEHFLYTSTASIYGEADLLPTPEDYHRVMLPYAASKFSAEHYCNVFYNRFKLPITILRLSNVFGPGQSPVNPYCGVVAKFFEAIASGQPPTIYGNGEQTRDFVYIEDALDAVIHSSLNRKAIGRTYNIGTGRETSVINLAKIISKITGYSGELEYKPKREVDVVNRRCLNVLRIKKELNWQCKFTLSQGLENTFQWLIRWPQHESISWNN